MRGPGTAPPGARLHEFDTASKDGSEWTATWGAGGRRILTAGPYAAEVWDAEGGTRLRPAAQRRPGPGHEQDEPRTGGERSRRARAGARCSGTSSSGGKPSTLPGEKGDPLEYSLLSSDGRRARDLLLDAAGFCVWDGTSSATHLRPRREGRPRRGLQPRRPSRPPRLCERHRRGVGRELEDSEPIAVLGHGGAVSSAQFDRKGRYVVTGGDDGGGAGLAGEAGEAARGAARAHGRRAIRARLSPDGLQVATVSDDGSGRLWPSRLQAPIDPRWQWADSTTFSPSSPNVLVVRHGSNASESGVWNVDTGTIVPLRGDETVPSVCDHPTWPCGRAAGCSPWSADGESVAGVSAAGNAAIWNAGTGKTSACRGSYGQRRRCRVQLRRPPPCYYLRRSAEAKDLGRHQGQAAAPWYQPSRTASLSAHSSSRSSRRIPTVDTSFEVPTLRSGDGCDCGAVQGRAACGRSARRRRPSDCPRRRHEGQDRRSRVLRCRDSAPVPRSAGGSGEQHRLRQHRHGHCHRRAEGDCRTSGTLEGLRR